MPGFFPTLQGGGILQSSDQQWKQIISQKITVSHEKCISCGACFRVCPFMVYEMHKVGGKKKAVPVHVQDCFICQSCQAQCPTDAIIIKW